MALKRMLLVLCAGWMVASATGAAGQQVSTHNVTGQPLGEALSEFAARTGLQVVYLSDIVAPLTANPVAPGLPPADTLERMLAGTGLRFEFLNVRTVRIFADATRGPRATAGAASHAAESSSGRSSGESTKLDEVFVTAMHQAEWASQVPMSLSVWSQEEMRISGIKGILELGAMTPALSFDWRSNLGAGVYTSLVMRGVSGTHGVATGIQIDDTSMPAGWHDSYQRAFPSTFDLERIEVLRGAQGMLLGQGTLGGAIRFITTAPSLSAYSGYVTAEMATTESGAMSYEAGAAAGGPVIDDILGIRVSGWYRTEGGFVDRFDPATSELVDQDSNTTTSRSGRIGLAWQATDAMRITSTLSYDSNRADDSASFFVNESDPAHGVFRNFSFINQPREDRFYVAAIKLEHESAAGSFLAASSYVDRVNHSVHDLTCSDGCEVPFFFLLDGGQRVLQQELRFASTDQNPVLTWLIGAHLSRSEWVGRLGESDAPPDQRVGTRIDQTQVEGYAQLSRRIGARLSASAGARIARSAYDYASLPAPVFTGSDGESLIIPRFELSYHAKSGSLLYLTAAKGYGGGTVVPAIPGCEPVELLADTVWNYEAGAKTDLLDGRAHLEASVFNSRWSNRQHDPVVFACLTGFQKGQAESDGFDLAGQALIGERATFGLEVSYVDARYTQSVVSDGVVIVRPGDAVHDASLPWSLSAFVEYELKPIYGVTVTAYAEGHYHGGDARRRLEDNPDSPFYRAFGNADASTSVLNLRVNASVGQADIAAFMTNVLDSHPVLNRFPGPRTAYTLRPRTVGVSATWSF